MKLLERVYYSIIGKPIKSLLMLLVTLLLGTFMAASFSVFQATKNLEKTILNNLSPVILIDWKDVDNANKSKIDDFIEDLKDDDSIKIIENRYLLNLGQFQIRLFDDEGNMIPYESFNHQLIGIDQYDVADCYNGEVYIKDGRIFTNEEIQNGESVLFLMMNKDSTSLYPNLNVNDELTLKFVPNEYAIFDDIYTYGDLEVVGIGVGMGENNTVRYHSLDTMITAHNQYIPLELMNQISEGLKEFYHQLNKENPDVIYSDLNGEKYIKETYIQLNDASELTSFIMDINLKTLNLPRTIYSYADSYRDVQIITRNMKVISIIALVVSALSAIVLLSLVIQIFVKERRHEIGVYLSLGESKKRVATQIIIEVLIVGMLGLSLSLFTGNEIGKALSDDMLNREIMQYEELIDGEYNEDYDVSKDEILDTYSVSITSEYIIGVFTCGLLVFVLSSVYPTMTIMKMKPKNMLG